MKFQALVMLILLLEPVMAIRFTEIMYDPAGSDNNREFLELQGGGNFSAWIISDLASNDTLLPLQNNESSNYSLIVEEGFNHSGLRCNIYSAGATIGNSLNNGGDTITLYAPNGSAVLEQAYNDSLAKSNDHSLEWANGSWRESDARGGSPCLPNKQAVMNATPPEEDESLAYDPGLEVLLDERIYQGVAYPGLFKVRNYAYTSGESKRVNVSVEYNLTQEGRSILEEGFSVILLSYKSAGTGRLLINETGEYRLCGKITRMNVSDNEEANNRVCENLTVVDPFKEPCNISLAITTERQLFTAGESAKFSNHPTRHDNGSLPPFSITYWIEDLSGREVRNRTTGNTHQKSFTPSVKEEVEVFLLKNKFEMLACNNSNNNTRGERLVVFKGESERMNESVLEITDLHVPEEGYRFGEEMKVSVMVYKGDTGKYSVKLWIEGEKGKVSPVATLHAKESFTTHTLVLPLQLEGEHDSGDYRVILEGLGKRTSRRVKIAAKEEMWDQREEEGQLTIHSFYTRSKKAADEINLYATIKGKGNITLELLGLEDYYREDEAINGSFRMKKRARMRCGPNIFLLRIVQQGETVEERTLLLEMGGEIEEVEKFSGNITCEEDEEGIEEIDQVGEDAAQDESTDEDGAMTGATVAYLPEDGRRIIPLFLGLIGAVLLTIIIRQR